MAVILSPDQQEWVLAELGALLQILGEGPFVEGVIWLPIGDHFPLPYEADHAHLATFATQIAEHAGLADYRLRMEVVGADQYAITGGGGRCRRSRAPARFGGIRGQTVTFLADEQLPATDDGLVAGIAHEVAHGFRAIHDLKHRNYDLEECLTDITEFYLGFGVFSLNESYTTLEEGPNRLSPWAKSFLLAAQIVARRMTCWQTYRLLRHVHSMARRDVRRGLALLRPADDLWKRLRPPIPQFELS